MKKRKEIYEKYKNMCYKLALLHYKKSYDNTKYDFNDLVNEAFIGVIVALDTYKDNKDSKIETWVYNNINYHLSTFAAKNIYSVHVPNNTLFNLSKGYNRVNYVVFRNLLENKLKENEINEKELEGMLKEFKDNNKIDEINELKEYKQNKENDNEDDFINLIPNEEDIESNTINDNTTDLIKKELQNILSVKEINYFLNANNLNTQKYKKIEQIIKENKENFEFLL